MGKKGSTTYPRRFPNWFVREVYSTFNLKIGLTFFTGHGSNETVGEYIITDLTQVDRDTVHVICKRMKP